ncbi:MAG: hypothetical protein C4526_00030 [Nitrospiraceae bacterium]|nr:MAG: hypothetical protein C4526_00030 [Nitrospiraceae bacterium]
MQRKSIPVICILLIFYLSRSITAATLTWSGSGSDNLASNPANWSVGRMPQNGDKVVFDAASSKDCIWDLPITISSLTITSGYTGKVILSDTQLIIEKFKTWNGGGADSLASNPANWSDNVIPQNGDKVLFDETTTKDCIWDINVAPASMSLTGYTGTATLNTSLTINGSLGILSGVLNLNNRNLDIGDYLLIGINGNLYATSSTITVKSIWFNYGNFYPGTSTVILTGTNQTIYGNTIFYNLIKTVTSADTLYFEAGSTQTIINNLTLQGSANNLLLLRSTKNGQSFPEWYINPQGTRNISFADIKDLYCTNFTNIIVMPDSVNSGNNTGVSFGGSECI